MAYRDLILADTPALYITEDVTYGVTDQSGNGRNGTGAGGISIGADATTLVNGYPTCTDYDGADDKVSFPYAPFSNAVTRTFEGWAYRDTNVSADVLFGSSAAANFAQLFVTAAGAVTWQADNGSAGITVAAVATIPTATAFYWAFIFNESADTAEFFLNAASLGSVTAATAYNASAGNFIIGASSTTDAARNWDGKRGHDAVYERGLTLSEIQSHYQAGIGAGLAAGRSFIHESGRGQ